MIANIPGNSLGEQVDRKIVRPARVKTFAGQKKTEGALWVGKVVEDLVRVVAELNKNNRILIRRLNHESMFCSPEG
jgi:hypothetical protein